MDVVRRDVLEEQLEEAVFAPMSSSGTPRQKLDRMLDTIDALYEGGAQLSLAF